MLEKAATKKTFQYSLLGKELEAQTDIAKKQNHVIKKKIPYLKIVIDQIQYAIVNIAFTDTIVIVQKW